MICRQGITLVIIFPNFRNFLPIFVHPCLIYNEVIQLQIFNTRLTEMKNEPKNKPPPLWKKTSMLSNSEEHANFAN